MFLWSKENVLQFKFEVHPHNQLQVDIVNWSKHEMAFTFPGINNSFSLCTPFRSIDPYTEQTGCWKSKLQELSNLCWSKSVYLINIKLVWPCSKWYVLPGGILLNSTIKGNVYT